MLKDIPIYRYLSHLERKIGKKKAETLYNKKLSSVINTMKKRHNMVPLGGSGDKGRIVFVKLHPGAEKTVASKLQSIKANLKKIDKKAASLYEKSKKEYGKRFGKALEADFDKTFLSNVLYDMALNGFKTDFSTMKEKSQFRKNLKYRKSIIKIYK